MWLVQDTQVCALLYLGCVCYYIRQRMPPFSMHQYIVTSLKRLGQVAGARHTSACATILRLRTLLYQVACPTILVCVCYYIRLRAPHMCVTQYIVTYLKRLGQVAGTKHASSCATILRLCALIYQVACATFLRDLVYCNFLKEVRLGGWGQTRKCVCFYTQVACSTILGSVRHLSA